MNATRGMCLLAIVLAWSAIALGCKGGGGGGGSTNAAPTANNDAGTTPESTPIAFTSAALTANDVDAAGQNLTVIGAGNATLGTVSLAGGTATFTPALGAVGVGTFEYTVSDGALTDTALVSITITAVAGPCGDTTGPGGVDVRCSCGDTVVTDTVLANPLDPISTTPCDGDGLTIAAGRSLDLAGLTIAGSGTGTGVFVSGGTIANGAVQGFGRGMSVAGTDGRTAVSALYVAINAGVGIDIEVVGSTARVHLDDVTVQGNGGDGIHVRAAPGASNLDDALHDLDAAGYGVSISRRAFGGIVCDNGGAGIHIGATDQPADAAVKVTGVEAFWNAGPGILLEQDSDVAPGADCGESADQPGCAGATLVGNAFHDNGGAGVELRSGFLIPLYEEGVVELGLGFLANHVFHNAMGSGCTSEQTNPQIHVRGPVGLGNTTCGTATTLDACSALSGPSNHHCVWTGGTCVVAWDLRGDATPECSFANAIYDYNVSDSAPTSVGLRASNSSFVTAERNEWRTTNVSQDLSVEAGSFVQADALCRSRAMCSSP